MKAQTVNFTELFEFVRNGLNVNQDKSGKGVPISRIETISDGRVYAARVGFANLSAAENQSWLLRKGDVLFSHINSVEHIGKCAVYDGNPPELIHGMNLLCLRPDKRRVIPEFVKYIIRGAGFRGQLRKYVKKAVNQASVSISSLAEIKLPLPPLDEQRRIAAILDQADALRDKRRQALAQVEQLPQSVFLEMFGNRQGSLKTFGSLIREIRNGLSPSTKGSYVSNVLTLSAVTQGRFDPHQAKQGLFDKDPPASQRVQGGDLLICRGNGNRNLVGRGVVSRNDRQDLVFPDTVIAVTPLEEVDPVYLEVTWNSPPTRVQIESRASTTNGTYKINQRAIEQMQIPLPPLKLQQEFARRVEAIERLKDAHRRSLEEMDALFASLQHLAFRGEL